MLTATFATNKYDGRSHVQIGRTASALAAMRAYSASLGGVALVVMKDDRIEHEAFENGNDGDTLTASFSMHKSVVALAIGAAIDDGIITSVDVPVGDYLTEWAGNDRGKIPLRSFLTMTSGLKYFPLSGNDPRAKQLALGPNIERVALSMPKAQGSRQRHRIQL